MVAHHPANLIEHCGVFRVATRMPRANKTAAEAIVGPFICVLVPRACLAAACGVVGAHLPKRWRLPAKGRRRP